jgi:hypothetical protein
MVMRKFIRRRRPAKKSKPRASKATKALVRTVAKQVVASQLEDKYVSYTLYPAPP